MIPFPDPALDPHQIEKLQSALSASLAVSCALLYGTCRVTSARDLALALSFFDTAFKHLYRATDPGLS